jgi:hypothetical protein
MTHPIIIALDVIKSAANFTALAISFPVGMTEPQFSYTDSQGYLQKEKLLNDIASIPDTLRKPICEYLRRTSMVWTIASHGVEGQALNQAGLRLFERLQYSRPELAGVGLDNIKLYLPSNIFLTEIPKKIAQLVVSDWRSSAAKLLLQTYLADKSSFDLTY